ncbi:MAG: hypothetical protein ACREP6_03675, partial [Candidatus Binataceae bacterium]
MSIELARKIADAVLYEGYILYPYRASSGKNQFRWQFGVLAPRDWSESGGCESWWFRTECLAETSAAPVLQCKLRFLQVQRRIVEESAGRDGDHFQAVDRIEVDGNLLVTWEEGIEREVDIELPIAGRAETERITRFDFSAQRTTEPVYDRSGRFAARIVRETCALEGAIHLRTECLSATHPLLKLQITVQNTTPWHKP